MKVLSKIFNKTTFIYGGLGLLTMSGMYNIDRSIKNSKALNSVVTEYCEMALRSDSRALSYIGNNYKITHYELINYDRNSLSIKVDIVSSKGKSKLIAKCEKTTHKYLKAHFEQQLKFSLLSKDEKNMSPFTPINFNDILIPDKELEDKIKELSDKEIFAYFDEKNESGYYRKLNELKNIQIQDEDEFWRINSLILISKDSVIHSLRPISNRLKNYELEDTFYKLNNYEDVVANVIDFKGKYFLTLNKKLSNEEFRREINIMKHNNMEKRGRTRKYVVISEMIFFATSFLLSRLFLSKTILNHPSHPFAIDFIKSSTFITQTVGSNPAILFTTGYYGLSGKVNYKVYIQGPKNAGYVNFNAVEVPDYIEKSKLVLRDKEPIALDKKVVSTVNNQPHQITKLIEEDEYSELREHMMEITDEYEKEEKDLGNTEKNMETNAFVNFNHLISNESSKSEKSTLERVKGIFSKKNKI
jgi:hypothetical protein